MRLEEVHASSETSVVLERKAQDDLRKATSEQNVARTPHVVRLTLADFATITGPWSLSGIRR